MTSVSLLVGRTVYFTQGIFSILTICLLGIFMLMLSFADSFLPKLASGYAIRVSKSLDPDQNMLSVLIFVQTVCKCYQQNLGLEPHYTYNVPASYRTSLGSSLIIFSFLFLLSLSKMSIFTEKKHGLPTFDVLSF